MGSFVGHVVPGSMFLLMSVWWYVGALRVCFQNKLATVAAAAQQTRKAKRATGLRVTDGRAIFGCMGRKASLIPFEPITKVCLAITGILGELLYEKQWALLNEESNFVKEHLNNYAHASMFGFFGLSGIVDLVMFYDLAPLPAGIDFVFVALAFFVEGFLFYFHLEGRPELNVRVHTFVYMVAFFTFFILILEMLAKNRSIPALARAFLTSLHGSWFFQIAFVLHGSKPWQNTSENIEFLAIAFVMHIFALAILYLAVFVVVYRGWYTLKLRVREPLLQESDEEF